MASPSTGFTFDVDLGVPVRVRAPLGPSVGNKAVALGRGRVNLGLMFTHWEYSRFDGQSLSSVRVDEPLLPGTGAPDTVRSDLNVKIRRQFLWLSGALGVTDDLDAGFSIPYILTTLRVDGTLDIVDSDRIRFAPGGPQDTRRRLTGEADEEGWGDARIFGKYVVVRDVGWLGNVAISGDVKVPSGSWWKLTGTGSTQLTGSLIVSRDFSWFGPHLNGGFTYDTRHSENHVLRTLLGFDARLVSRLSVSGEMLWDYRPDGGIGANIVDFVAGIRWNPYRDLVVTGALQIPVNKGVGLRPDLAPSVSVEYTF